MARRFLKTLAVLLIADALLALFFTATVHGLLFAAGLSVKSGFWDDYPFALLWVGAWSTCWWASGKTHRTRGDP